MGNFKKYRNLIEIWVFALLFSISACTAEQEASAKSAPNIVLFFIDDMGWQDTSVPFWKETTELNSRYRTPNMERLAAEGMKFTQAYATPVCSPTRVSLLTGMNAARHRVTNWTLHKDKIQPMEANHPTLEFPNWRVNGMSAFAGDSNAVHATPLPEVLQEKGYTTVHAGKAHFGAIGTPGENPLNLGFDINIAGHAAGAPGSYHGEDAYGNNQPNRSLWAVPGLENYHESNINLTEALTLEAINTIDSISKTKAPFFLYLSHYTVHTPIMSDRRYFQKYIDQGLDSVEAKYASMVEAMDKSLGDVMDYLVEQDLEENTAVLFMSDNGGLSAVARGETAHTHNKPLSSGKGSIYEGGIREPMLVKWPGRIKPNTVNDNYLIIEDFYPSILEIAGINNPKTVQEVDGQSFVYLFDSKVNQTTQNRALYWHYPNEWGPSGPGIGAFSAIRKGDFKLIYYHQTEAYELFNISEDIGEKENLYAQYPSIAYELSKDLRAYLISVDAQMPVHKSTGKSVSLP